MTDEKRVRGRQESRGDARQRGFPQRPDRADPVRRRPRRPSHKRPLVIVPPCINKYYILDLQPENSLVRYVVDAGHTVFMVSWRNIPPELGHLTWDDYLEQGALTAIRVAREICGSKHGERAGLLRRRHRCSPARWRCSPRATHGVGQRARFADGDARLRRSGRNRRLRLARIPGRARAVAASTGQRVHGRANSPARSPACAPTISSGTTSSTTTSRARRRRRSTSSTGTATRPTCRARCTSTT